MNEMRSKSNQYTFIRGVKYVKLSGDILPKTDVDNEI